MYSRPPVASHRSHIFLEAMLRARIARARASQAQQAASSQNEPGHTTQQEQPGHVEAEGGGGRSTSLSPESRSRSPKGPPAWSVRRLLQPTKSAPEEPLPAGWRSASWWAQIQRNSVASKWDDLHLRFTPTSMVIYCGCAGQCTELFGLRLLGIPFVAVASEAKEIARDMLVANFTATELPHILSSLADHMKSRAECSRHSGLCCHQLATVHIFVVGPPCQPYSGLTSDRRTGTFSRHPLYPTIFGRGGPAGTTVDPDDNVITVIKRVLPLAVLVEEVDGFARVDPIQGVSPLRQFLQEVFAIEGPDKKPFYIAARAFHMDSNMWVEISRPRSQR